MALFSKKTSVIGVDVGSNCVKILQLNKSKSGQWSLAAYGKSDLPPEAIVDGSVMNTGVIVDAIKELLTQYRIKTNKVVASVSGNAVIIKRITLQSMSLDELEEVIQWEAEQYIPFDISDVNIDVQILDGANPDPGQMDVLLVAARRDLVNEQMSLLQQAGLNPTVIDVDSFALANMFAYNYEYSEGTIALVNVGSSSVNIHVIRNGISVFTRDLNMGGSLFTEEIQRTLNISYEEAEKMKIGGDDEESDSVVPQEIEEILLSVGESVASEIQRSLDFYLSTSTDGFIDQIYMSGGAAQTPGLVQAVNQQTGINTEIIDPFRNVQVDERAFKPSFLDDVGPQFAVSVGLAMRSINTLTEDDHPILINLLPQRQSRRFEQVRKEFNSAALFLLLLAGFFFAWHSYIGNQESSIKAANQKLKTEIQQKKAEVDKVQLLKEQRELLNEKLEAIAKLKRAKMGPVRMLDELAISTPEKLKINTLSETGGKVNISGVAASNPDISKFITEIEESKYFIDVYLNTIEKVVFDGIKMKSFSISAQFKVPDSKSDKGTDDKKDAKKEKQP